MKCPRCHSEVINTAEQCGSCGFASQVLCQRLGDHWVRLDRLTDPANCLRLHDRRRLEAKLDDFERRFPQIFFAVYFGVLPGGFSVSEVGFWLLNHAAFGTHDISKRNEFGIVLVIDPSATTAAFTLGYSLEGVEAGLQLESVLKSVSPSLKKGDFGKAVEQSIRRVDRKLRAVGTCHPKESRISPAHAVSADLGLTPLRNPARAALVEREPSPYRLDP